MFTLKHRFAHLHTFEPLSLIIVVRNIAVLIIAWSWGWARALGLWNVFSTECWDLGVGIQSSAVQYYA